MTVREVGWRNESLARAIRLGTRNAHRVSDAEAPYTFLETIREKGYDVVKATTAEGIPVKRELARVTETFLGVEDHGIATAFLTVEYETGDGQGIGMYALDEPVEGTTPTVRVGTAKGMEMVLRLIRACGARSWEDIVGKTIYVLTDDDRRTVGIQPVHFGTGAAKEFLFEEVYPREKAGT